MADVSPWVWLGWLLSLRRHGRVPLSPAQGNYIKLLKQYATSDNFHVSGGNIPTLRASLAALTPPHGAALRSPAEIPPPRPSRVLLR